MSQEVGEFNQATWTEIVSHRATGLCHGVVLVRCQAYDNTRGK